MAPICLPRGNIATSDYYGKSIEVAGWGITDSTAPPSMQIPSNFLMFVSLPVVETSVCEFVYSLITSVDYGQLCVGGVMEKDSCGGDSGGPAMYIDNVNEPPQYFIVGIVSFGPIKCGTKAAVYTKINSYMDWILNNLREI